MMTHGHANYRYLPSTYVVTVLNQTPMFKWQEHKTDTCYNEIGLCPQNMDTVLSSTVNITTGRANVIT